MKGTRSGFFIAAILTWSSANGQKIKRADRAVLSNMQTHIAILSAQQMEGRKAGTAGEKRAADYISKHFEHFGLEPKGDSASWYQRFEIYDGKEILSSDYFNINNHKLVIQKEYFPFPFSAVKKAEGTIAIALAETGYPWFKDLSDIIGNEEITDGKIYKLIADRAKQAATKGASALIIYNTGKKELVYEAMDSSTTVNIPVIYITKAALKKYCPDESALIDVKINVALKTKKRTSINIIGYADHGADSTIITGANLANEKNIAALIEIARLSKTIKPAKNNYLFIACSEEQKKQYYTLNLDSMSLENDGIDLVKKSIDLLKK